MTCVYLLQRSMGAVFSREYLQKSDTVSDGSNGDLDQGNLSVTEIARRIVELDEKESKTVEQMEHDHKKELNNMMEEYKKNRDETCIKHAHQIKKFRSENEKNNLVLGKKLHNLLGRYLEMSDTVSEGSNGDLSQGNLSVTEIARRIVELDEKESKNVEKMKHDHKKEENNMIEEYKNSR